MQLLSLAIVTLVNSLSERPTMDVLGNSDFSRFIYVEKSREHVVLLCCVLGMYTCARFGLTALGSIFVKSYALGLFCRHS